VGLGDNSEDCSIKKRKLTVAVKMVANVVNFDNVQGSTLEEIHVKQDVHNTGKVAWSIIQVLA